MKKSRISFFCCCIILLAIFFGGCFKTDATKQEYLRVHIRANSNSEADQRVKYEVRDAVVEYLTPIVAGSATKEAAIENINRCKDAIKRLIDGLLEKKGFNYASKSEVRNENFPTRSYDDLTLSAGYYDALIIELGAGKGDNWWCVVYPPLCFTDGEDVRYRSKIYDIINSFNK